MRSAPLVNCWGNIPLNPQHVMLSQCVVPSSEVVQLCVPAHNGDRDVDPWMCGHVYGGPRRFGQQLDEVLLRRQPLQRRVRTRVRGVDVGNGRGAGWLLD